jgi:long-chain fatty acid transport protein
MNYKQRSLLAASILVAFGAHSAGFQVAEHSASGLGRAFSGEGAVADNASVLARNPAAMTLFETAQFSGALSIVDPEVNVTLVDGGPGEQSAKDVAPMQIVPAAYFISPIDENWAWGFGMFTNYGVATDYPDDFYVGDVAGDTALISVNLNPNIAYRINEQFSIGAGLNLVYAEAELNRHIGGALPVSGNPQDKLISMTGETFGFGWNIGALYELDENNRFGFGYRSEVELDFDDGTFTDHTGSVLGYKGSVDGRLTVDLPDIIELSAFHQLNDDVAIHYGWQMTRWSSFTELKATDPNNDSVEYFKKEEDYSDNQRWSFGLTYQYNNDLTLRGGLAFDEQAGKATLSIPDSDRFWYSAGLTYAIQDNLTFDFGFALVVSDDGKFTESDQTTKSYTFESEGVAYISAAQLNYTFN